MRRSRQFRIWLVLLLICSLLAPQGSAADKQEIIRQAKRAYYNLPSQGLIEMQSAVDPNWGAILKEELKTDVPPDHPAFKILNGLHFRLSLDEKGAAKLTHQTDNTPTDQASIENMNHTISGVEQVLSGFSQTVAPFLFTSPFPEVESAYELEEQGDQYRCPTRKDLARRCQRRSLPVSQSEHYFNLPYSNLAAMKMGMPGSASFQSVRKS